MIACYKGHYKIAKYLIDIQADVNRKSVKGNTALHDCAESGSLEIMKLLLANEAKIDVDAYGQFISTSCLYDLYGLKYGVSMIFDYFDGCFNIIFDYRNDAVISGKRYWAYPHC